MSQPGSPDSRAVRITQWALLGFGAVFISGIISWVIHLIRTALVLGDTPSASIGISLVAVPIFLTLLSVLVYVFLGMLTDRSRP